MLLYSGGGGSNAAATAVLDPIYYDVLESTPPSAGYYHQFGAESK